MHSYIVNNYACEHWRAYLSCFKRTPWDFAVVLAPPADVKVNIYPFKAQIKKQL